MSASDNFGASRISLRHRRLLIIVVLVVLVSIWVPAYRLFLLLSIVIGVMIAGGLYLWHKYRPLKEEEVQNKRPLRLGRSFITYHKSSVVPLLTLGSTLPATNSASFAGCYVK